MDYFETAKQIVREDALKKGYIKATPCECDAYTFPHRKFSGSCEGPHLVEYATDTMNAWDREELNCFNKAESQSINQGK
jgi:hypothetical protein